MKQGKYAAPVRRRRRRNTLKPMLIAMAVVLLLGCVTGGTLAWLTDTTDPVVNTFTVGDINIDLTETFNTDSNSDGKNDSWQGKMIPGHTIDKDPKVTVLAGSEECWLFVKLEKSNNFDSFMEYTVDSGWAQLKNGANQDVTGVYYRKVETADIGTPYSVLNGNQVSVKSTVTKANMNGLTQIVDGKPVTNYPTLTVTAYASQLHKNGTQDFTAYEAWEVLNPAPPTT